jgi:hypothetical protein
MGKREDEETRGWGNERMKKREDGERSGKPKIQHWCSGSLPNFGVVMETLLPVFVLTLVFMSLGFAGLAIRMFFLKKGEFRGTCSTHNPLLRERGVDCAGCPNRYLDRCPATQS